MQDNKTQQITYIGKKKPKLDTVAGTGIIWECYGDTQEVMHSAAVKLLQHKDVWIREKDFEGKAAEVKPSQASSGLSDSTPVAPVAPVAQDSESEGESEGEPEAAPIDLKNTIIILYNENDKENFTERGTPKVDAVNARAEGKYSANEIKAALKELNLG